MYSLAIGDVLVDSPFQHLCAIYRTSTFDKFVTFFSCKHLHLKVKIYLKTKQIKINDENILWYLYI